MPKSSKPLVSIITPTYNCAALLPETIESILCQDYPNFEYIVLDDGSQDHTVELLKQYADPRLRWESHDNMGEARTVNKGLEMAQGEYLIVVSADDPVKPGLLEIGIDYMERNPSWLVGYPGWTMIDDKSNPIQEWTMFEYDYDVLLRWHWCAPGPGSIIRRKSLEFEAGRDPNYRYTGDYEYWLRLGLHGPFGYIPHSLANWRAHASSTTVQISGKQHTAGLCTAAEHVKMVKALYQRPNLPAHVLSAKREAMSSAYLFAAIYSAPHSRGITAGYILRSILSDPFAPKVYPSGTSRSLHTLHRLLTTKRS